jgi:hypothetical protein
MNTERLHRSKDKAVHFMRREIEVSLIGLVKSLFFGVGFTIPSEVVDDI